MLPGNVDGLTLCREYLRRFSDIPIVMVTAKIEEIGPPVWTGDWRR